MNILKLLASESFLTLNKPLARLVGLEAAALFADLASSQVYWDNEKGTQGEYFYRTRTMIEDHTTLSPKLQLKAEKALKKLGIIQVQLKGLPATNHYCIGQQEQLNLLNKISPMGVTRQDQREQLDATNGRTIKNKEIKNTVLKIDNNKEKGEQVSHTPLEDNSDKVILSPPKRKRKAKIEFKFPPSFTPDVIQAVESYMQMRKDIGKAIKSQQSFSILCNDCEVILTHYGKETLLYSIECSISAEWKRVYLKQPQGTNGKPQGNIKQPVKITDREMHDKVLTLECTLKNLRIYTSNLDSLKDQEKLDVMQEIYTTHKNKQNELH